MHATASPARRPMTSSSSFATRLSSSKQISFGPHKGSPLAISQTAASRMSESASGTALKPSRAIASIAALIHRRDVEVRILAHALGPASGHRLQPREEAHPVRAMLVRVAESGALPTAEAVIGERHGYRHIDADHADIDAG